MQCQRAYTIIIHHYYYYYMIYNNPFFSSSLLLLFFFLFLFFFFFFPTQPLATQLVIAALQEAIKKGVIEEPGVTQERLEQFLSWSRKRFYELPDSVAEGPHKTDSLATSGYCQHVPRNLRADYHVGIQLLASGSTLYAHSSSSLLVLPGRRIPRPLRSVGH